LGEADLKEHTWGSYLGVQTQWSRLFGADVAQCLVMQIDDDFQTVSDHSVHGIPVCSWRILILLLSGVKVRLS
jgi:hypothetical protein